MVKFFAFLLTLTLFFLSSISQAAFYVGVQNNSWQDAIPVTYTDAGSGQTVSFYSLTTFSSLSTGGGYEGLFSTRWRYAADLYYHWGTADIHKIQGTISPRKSFNSFWFSPRISYRITKTFTIGPQLVINSITVRDAGSATSLGGLIHSDIEMTKDLRLVQTFGSMNDSGTIAYTIGLQKYF